MDVKEWLESIKNIENEINALKETLQIAESRVYSVTGNSEAERVSESKVNRHEINLYKYMHLKEILSRRTAQLFAAQSDAVTAISRLNNTTYRTVLTQRFINGKTIPEIADSVGFTERWTAKLVERALEELTALYNDLKAV